MPSGRDPSTDVTPPSIREKLSTLIAISTANVRLLDEIITQMVTVNTLIGIQTETMAKLILHPPPNQQARPLSPTSTPPLLPPQQSLLSLPPPKPLQSSMSTQQQLLSSQQPPSLITALSPQQQFLSSIMPPPKTTYITLPKTIPAKKTTENSSKNTQRASRTGSFLSGDKLIRISCHS
ncbi:unnamed protein product [Lactuca virosa]|uniref:Uncharacterized protein n=1 Tax=Lactuca virosa TaxID=75947 RepID=A0AAU9MS10_9ASTR|nr:unnamed protein product [Lactuca virosa]